MMEHPAIKVREKRCKTALSETDVSGYDYTVNPYTGCLHGCVYCYANYMRRFSGHLNGRRTKVKYFCIRESRN